jgi:hypothetical protein
MKKTEYEDFKKDAIRDYFKMQLENQRNRKIFKYAIFFLMIFLPFVIISYKSMQIILQASNNANRIENDEKEIQNYGENLIKNQEFLSSLSFKDDKAIVYLDAIYNKKYSISLEKKYFDKKYEHQCLGYFVILKENSTYKINTDSYCKM